EEELTKYKRAKAEPITAPVKGQVLWEIDVVSPSQVPAVGRKYMSEDIFCYITTPWGTHEGIKANFTGRIIEVCAKQGGKVGKGDVLAYIERERQP
ncbi:hypothetical protein EZS27_035921, partial [termite gut metagenome]